MPILPSSVPSSVPSGVPSSTPSALPSSLPSSVLQYSKEENTLVERAALADKGVEKVMEYWRSHEDDFSFYNARSDTGTGPDSLIVEAPALYYHRWR